MIDYRNIDHKTLYLSAEGRMSRKDYAQYYIIPAIVLYVGALIIDNILHSDGAVSLLMCLVLIWPTVVTLTKRLHDVNKSGWWQMVMIIPIVGFIFWVVIACTKGDTGVNKYGAEPLEVTHVSQ